jgi:hypothetical protein
MKHVLVALPDLISLAIPLDPGDVGDQIHLGTLATLSILSSYAVVCPRFYGVETVAPGRASAQG